MIKVAFVIVSVSDRVNELNHLVESIMKFPKFDDYKLCLCYQDYLGNFSEVKYKDRYDKIIVKPEKMGCNGARVFLLQNIKYDYYINLDDDMELVEQTDYTKALLKSSEKTTGFVLTNWARSRNMLEAKIPKMCDKFIPQTMVYQGGGMVYSEKVAQLIRRLPVKKTMFDDIWCITTYVNGYTNYRYQGSLALHFICSKGGMRLFMREENPELGAEEFINYQKGKREGEWLIPLDKDINDWAKFLHEKNKEKLK